MQTTMREYGEISLTLSNGGDLVIDVIESLYGTIAEESSNLSTSTNREMADMQRYTCPTNNGGFT